MSFEKTEKPMASATLRIHSSTLSPGEISSRLKTPPTQSFLKGEKMSPRNPSSATSEENLWTLESRETESISLEAHILWLADFIEQSLPALKSLLTDCEIDIFCGYSSLTGQGGFTLDAEVMKRLSEIPIDITFDIYC